jgi:hypothetical protein
MSKIEKLIAAHPLCGAPYDKLEFVRFDSRSVPLYKVRGSDEPPTGAFEALGRAFQRMAASASIVRRALGLSRYRTHSPKHIEIM